MAQGINHFWAVCWDLISYFHVWLRWFLFCATVRACLRRPLAPAGPRTIIAHSSASATLSTGRHFSIGLAGWNVEMCLRQPKDMQLGREPQLQTEGSTSWHSCQIKMTGQIGVCLCVRACAWGKLVAGYGTGCQLVPEVTRLHICYHFCFLIFSAPLKLLHT